jgi:hypothetical protein
MSAECIACVKRSRGSDRTTAHKSKLTKSAEDKHVKLDTDEPAHIITLPTDLTYGLLGEFGEFEMPLDAQPAIAPAESNNSTGPLTPLEHCRIIREQEQVHPVHRLWRVRRIVEYATPQEQHATTIGWAIYSSADERDIVSIIRDMLDNSPQHKLPAGMLHIVSPPQERKLAQSRKCAPYIEYLLKSYNNPDKRANVLSYGGQCIGIRLRVDSSVLYCGGAAYVCMADKWQLREDSEVRIELPFSC